MDNHSLWQYSLQHYHRPGVEEALLHLQESHGADVNILLCCCWLADRGRVLEEQQLGQLLRCSARWSAECVRPLRAVRQYLKGQPGPESFRDRIKALELEAEQWQQQLLWEQLQAFTLEEAAGGFCSCALHNLALYSQWLPGVDGQEWSADIAELIARLE